MSLIQSVIDLMEKSAFADRYGAEWYIQLCKGLVNLEKKVSL